MFKFELKQRIWYLNSESLKPSMSVIQSRNFQEEMGRDWPYITYTLYHEDITLQESYIFSTREELLKFISE